MNNFARLASALALGLPVACAADLPAADQTQYVTADASTDISRTLRDKLDPCAALDSAWKPLFTTDYVFDPKEYKKIERVRLQGATVAQVEAIIQSIKSGVITKLCYVQENLIPLDSSASATRVCDSLFISSGPTSDVIECTTKELLPHGPVAPEKTLAPIIDVKDAIWIFANGGFDADLGPASARPVIHKQRRYNMASGNGYVSPFFPEHDGGASFRKVRISISGQ